jgi:predicted nucleic acid-binding protein
MVAGLLEASQAAETLRHIGYIVERFIDLGSSYVEAFSQSLHLNHSPYDITYLLLARHNAATLLTLDKELIALCEQLHVIGATSFFAADKWHILHKLSSDKWQL